MKNPCSKAEKQLRGEELGTKQRILTVLERKKDSVGALGMQWGGKWGDVGGGVG